MRHVRFSRWIKARPVFDDFSIYALRPAGDGIVKSAPNRKEIPLGGFPGSNVFVVHAFNYKPRNRELSNRWGSLQLTGFLHGPLHRAIYEKYKGRLLSDDRVLEEDMVALGVAHK